MTLLEQIKYRAKAILAAVGAALVGFVVWLVTNPDTATAIEKIVPEPWVAIVPVVLAGIAATIAVHQTPIRTPTALTRTTDDDELLDEPSTDTTAVQSLVSGQDGTETAGGR